MTAETAALAVLLAEIEAGRVRLDPADATACVSVLSRCLDDLSDPHPLKRRAMILKDCARMLGCAHRPRLAADRIRSAAFSLIDNEKAEFSSTLTERILELIEVCNGIVPSLTTIYRTLRE